MLRRPRKHEITKPHEASPVQEILSRCFVFSRLRGRRSGLLALLVGLCAGGCIDRGRLNQQCEWTNDSAFALDLARPADRRHLVADAQLAEGLAVKYADTEHRRRSGYGGHGGLLEYGGVLRQCYGPLVDRIARDHRVSAAQIDAARRGRDPRFDVPVQLSFAGFYALVAYAIGGRIRRRFADGS